LDALATGDFPKDCRFSKKTKKVEIDMQTIFDNVCRCFGHEDLNDGTSSNGSQGIRENSSQLSAKRRTDRLELKDKQWDALFEKSKTTSSPKKKSNEVDVKNAHAVAQAKLAANPPHRNNHNKPKRKRSVQARDDIFRSKQKEFPGNLNSGNGLSRLWNPSLALCFATPVRGASEEPDESDLRSVDNSDTATLNTCEDTIASTVVFESKYSHIKETRAPMPLYNQFKIGNDQDEISSIMASDSHSSMNMIRLLQKQQTAAKSQDSRIPKEDVEMEDVPGVKSASTSTDSSS
jgi:hypothetical protein